MRTCVLLAVLSISADCAIAGDIRWRTQILVESEHGMGGAAVGDLDPGSPGNEVAVVNAAGEVWMAHRHGESWQPQRIHKGEGEMIMCAIGDVDSRYRGNEFVGVGMVSGKESGDGSGQALLVRKDAAGWTVRPIFTDDRLLHGVAIGDVSARRPGNEVVVCGFNHRVTLLHQSADTWTHETIYVGNHRMKLVLVADVIPERDGQEVVACGTDGKVVVLWESELGWRHEVVYSDAHGQSRVAAGAPGILVGGDKGKVTLVHRDSGRWVSECLFRDFAKIRGTAIADIDPAHEGPELYACGYSGRVTQLVSDKNGYWHARTLYTADSPLHHLLAAEFDPTHADLELVTCGHGGKLIALSPE